MDEKELQEYLDLFEFRTRMDLHGDDNPIHKLKHNDSCFRRFLRAHGNIDDALKALIKTNLWRQEFGVSELVPDHPVFKKLFERSKIVMEFTDDDTRPIVYIPLKYIKFANRDVDEFTQFIVYCMELAISKCIEHVDQLCIVFDLKDFRLYCSDYDVIKDLLWVLNNHYPERLGICLLINVPMPAFAGCWTIVSSWLDDKTQNKIKFINSTKALNKYMSPGAIPVEL